MLTGKADQGVSRHQSHRWLIRHGESAANAGAATTDPATIPLTPAGWDQAHEVAAGLSERPDLIVVSSYLRTWETAEPTIRRFPDVAVETWPTQEFTYLAPACCINTTAEQRRSTVETYWHRGDPGHVDGPGAESFSAMLARARALRRQLAGHPAGCIAVFTHGQLMQSVRLLDTYPTADDQQLMARFLKFDREFPVRNGEVLVV